MKHFCKRGHVLVPVCFIAVFAAISAIVMLLWNALLPAILGVEAINYWQAAGIIVLSRLLFGGFGKFHQEKNHQGFHGFHAKIHAKKEFLDLHYKVKDMPCSDRREFIRKRMEEWEHGEK